jgi:dephospho-CoA kinase
MIIGLTGNIGSGKSSVAAYLSELGAKVVDTDQVARQIVAPGSPALAELIAAFDPGILNPDGTLNRVKMASIVFNSPGARQTLNKITHPRIRAEVNRHIDDHRRQSGAPALVIEAPLLIEAGFHHLVDEIWLVAADEETMLRRVARRDNTNLEQAAGRLASQMPQSEKIPLAHRVIDNNGAPEDFKRQVDRLWYTVVVQSK